MTLFKAADLNDLSKFSNRTEQLAIFERKAPEGAQTFMQNLMYLSFSLAGKVDKENAAQDIKKIVQEDIPFELKEDPFYETWLIDMAKVCKIFCETLKSDAICFSLGSKRGCNRYHTDNVPMRLLVTYAGAGTEWLPDHAADRKAYEKGAINEQIILERSAIQFMQTWDVAVFRGGSQGVLHRTPNAALDQASILMRLDPVSFWYNVLS